LEGKRVTFWRFGSGAPDSEPLCLRDVPALVSTYIYTCLSVFFFPFSGKGDYNIIFSQLPWQEKAKEKNKSPPAQFRLFVFADIIYMFSNLGAKKA